MTTLRRRITRLAVIVALLVTLWLLASLGVAYALTHRVRTPAPEQMPVVAWGKLRSFRLTTADGEDLGAWFEPGRVEMPVVVLLHGNQGQRRNCLRRAELLVGEGYGVLMVSFRCHGDSSGEINDFGLSACHDVVAAVRWLEAQSARPIFVWGESLGAAAAIFAAPELAERVRGTVLECPYRDLYTAVRNRTDLYLPPIASEVAYAGLITVAPLVLPDAERISPLAAITSMPPEVPVLILAGGADRHARPDEARELHDAIKSHSRLVIIDNAAHVRLYEPDADAYRETVLDFLAAAGR